MEKFSRRGYHKVGETAAMPGAKLKLAALVAEHMRTVFTAHREALEDDVDYSTRARDPLIPGVRMPSVMDDCRVVVTLR